MQAIQSLRLGMIGIGHARPAPDWTNGYCLNSGGMRFVLYRRMDWDVSLEEKEKSIKLPFHPNDANYVKNKVKKCIFVDFVLRNMV